MLRSTLVEFYPVIFKELPDYVGMKTVADQEFRLVTDCNGLRYFFFVRHSEIIHELQAGSVCIYPANQSFSVDQRSTALPS